MSKKNILLIQNYELKTRYLKMASDQHVGTTISVETASLTKLLGEFQISPTDLEEPIESDKVIHNVTVNQGWVERAINFAKVFFDVVDISEVDRQFRSSEFTNFDEFLFVNNINFMESQYFVAKTRHKLIKSDVVHRCFEKAKQLQPELTLSHFCEGENIVKLKDAYIQTSTQYPKSKLLEIIIGIRLADMTDKHGILTVDLLDNLFQSKTVALIMMLACYLAGLGSLLTSNNVAVKCEGLAPLCLHTYPIAMIIDKGYITAMGEWFDMTVDYVHHCSSNASHVTRIPSDLAFTKDAP